ARSVNGTEVTPLFEPDNCTDADRSLGVAGSVEFTVTVRLAPGASVNVDGETEPCVVKFCSSTCHWKVPLKPLPRDSARYAVHLPAVGKRTSDTAKFAPPCGIE